jgi:hypothetical protein
MKSLRILAAVFVVLLSTAALADSSAPAFEKMKSLAGSWEGKASNGMPVQVSYRTTSNGAALMSEITGHEDMISMFHMDGDRLMMTHYCAAGNQPRMVGTISPDGKTIKFDFLDATNVLPSQPGHMQHLTVTIVDANHHTEDWDFAANDGKTMHEVFDLTRK